MMRKGAPLSRPKQPHQQRWQTPFEKTFTGADKGTPFTRNSPDGIRPAKPRPVRIKEPPLPETHQMASGRPNFCPAGVTGLRPSEILILAKIGSQPSIDWQSLALNIW
eukprot:6185316-Pleurochrysis_carterae.AAC.4